MKHALEDSLFDFLSDLWRKWKTPVFRMLPVARTSPAGLDELQQGATIAGPRGEVPVAHKPVPFDLFIRAAGHSPTLWDQLVGHHIKGGAQIVRIEHRKGRGPLIHAKMGGRAILYNEQSFADGMLCGSFDLEEACAQEILDREAARQAKLEEEKRQRIQAEGEYREAQARWKEEQRQKKAAREAAYQESCRDVRIILEAEGIDPTLLGSEDNPTPLAEIIRKRSKQGMFGPEDLAWLRENRLYTFLAMVPDRAYCRDRIEEGLEIEFLEFYDCLAEMHLLHENHEEFGEEEIYAAYRGIGTNPDHNMPSAEALGMDLPMVGFSPFDETEALIAIQNETEWEEGWYPRSEGMPYLRDRHCDYWYGEDEDTDEDEEGDPELELEAARQREERQDVDESHMEFMENLLEYRGELSEADREYQGIDDNETDEFGLSRSERRTIEYETELSESQED